MDGSESKKIHDPLDQWRRRREVAYILRDISWAGWQIFLPGLAMVILILALQYEELRDRAILGPSGLVITTLAGAKLWRDQRKPPPPLDRK